MDVRDVLPRDAIPSIDDPGFGTTYFGDPDDEVVVVEGDPARAYPFRILGSHEVVNDTVDDQPVAVTWCPICWSAVVYDRSVDGRTLTFGVSGKLADDALVLYDHETDSEWQGTTGTAITGEFEGRQLAALPAQVVTWARFQAASPDGVILQPPDGEAPHAARARYDMAPYEAYRERDEFGLYGMRGEGDQREWDRDDDIGPKTVVVGIQTPGAATAYPLPRVRAAGGVVTDTVGEREVVVVADEDGSRAFDNPGDDFERREGRLHADGTTWDPMTGESEDGRRLQQVPIRRLFAFAWQDACGPESFYSAASSTS